MSVLVRTASSKSVKPRTAWSFLVLKVKTSFEVHIMWKDSRNCLELYKMRGKDKVKKQFGLVAQVQVVNKNNDSGELAQYYQVKNKYCDTINFKSSLMNPGIVGLNTFTKKILDLRSVGNDVELATYISQLCKSKDFSQHNEDVHTKLGQLTEETRDEEDTDELEKFFDAARECATSVTSTADDAIGLIAENTKRRKKADVKNKTTSKLGTQERIEKYFHQEIVDPEGIEQTVVKKGLGRSDIPIDCLTVCKKVQLPIYDEKVNALAKDMFECFDATQMYLTVVPVDQELFDPINLDNNLYEVVHGRHRIMALQKLDQEKKLTSLATLSNRTVTCFIIGVSDDVAVNYLWHRGNKLAAKFVFSPSHHDLLFTLQGLKLINRESEQVMKAVERYASLQKKSDAEKLALRNFSKWPNEALDLLKQVLLKYQNYQTADTDDKVMKKSFTKLQRGEKLLTPMSLFREVSKLPPDHFKESSKDILDGKLSLKDLAKEHSKELERRKKEALIMENSGYHSFQNLKDHYPDHFSDKIIEQLPVNTKSSSSHQPSIESYTKSVCNKKEMKEESSSQQQLKLIELNADLAEITSLLGRARRRNVQDMLKNDLKEVQNKLKEEVSDPYAFKEIDEGKIGQLDGHLEEISINEEIEQMNGKKVNFLTAHSDVKEKTSSRRKGDFEKEKEVGTESEHKSQEPKVTKSGSVKEKLSEDQAYDLKKVLSEYVKDKVDSEDNESDVVESSEICLDAIMTVNSIIQPESDMQAGGLLSCSNPIPNCGDEEIASYTAHFSRKHDLPLDKIRVHTEQGKLNLQQDLFNFATKHWLRDHLGRKIKDVAFTDIIPKAEIAARVGEELSETDHGHITQVVSKGGPARGGYQCMAGVYDMESQIDDEALRVKQYQNEPNSSCRVVFNMDKVKSVPVPEAAPAEHEDVNEDAMILDIILVESDDEKKRLPDFIEEETDIETEQMSDCIEDKAKVSVKKEEGCNDLCEISEDEVDVDSKEAELVSDEELYVKAQKNPKIKVDKKCRFKLDHSISEINIEFVKEEGIGSEPKGADLGHKDKRGVSEDKYVEIASKKKRRRLFMDIAV